MKKLILFDFDGVILDSFSAAFGTSQLMCPHLTEDQYRMFFEGNIFNTGQSYFSDTSHSESCRHDTDFWEHYIPRLKRDGRLFPGMEVAVRALAQEHTLIIVSSGDDVFIKEFLAENELAPHFDRVMGNAVHTSKEEKIKMVFADYGAEAHQCIFVTDTLGDMHEAARMEVGSIGVTWGFHEPERLAKGNPFRLVETPKHIPQAVTDYFARS